MKGTLTPIKGLLTCVIALLIVFQSQAKETLKSVQDVVLKKSESDPNLAIGTSAYVFEFKGASEIESDEYIWYSIDGKSAQIQLSDYKMRLETSAGKHVFQFNVSPQYAGISTDSLSISSQFVDSYHINLQLTEIIQVVTCKPVIYLYPEVTQEISVKVDIFGDSPFYYPRYDDGWDVTAQPNGLLLFKEERFRYLFWEAHQDDHLSSISSNEGFVVNGEDAQAFLEDKLNAVGFTSEEKADFITYWGPRMAALDQSYVRFEWNETCDKFAELSITPRPDQLFRFYIFVGPAPESLVVAPQELPHFERSGFTVLEWGGQYSNLQSNKTL